MVVIIQECERINALIAEAKRSLRELDKGLKVQWQFHLKKNPRILLKFYVFIILRFFLLIDVIVLSFVKKMVIF